MALYYFHTETDARLSDNEGVEVETPFLARKEAIALCGRLMLDAADSFWGSRPWKVTVTDATGLILWELSMDGFSAAAAPVD